MKVVNKNKVLVIGIIGLIVMIFGATYAYFTVSTTNNFGSKTISTSLGALGSVVLKAGNNLKLDLTTQDMVGNTADKIYYASSSGKTETPTTEVIGTAKVVGTGIFQCSYKIKVEDKSTKSMYTVFQNMSTKSTNQIILTINGKDYDFNTANLFPLTITGKFTNLVAGKNQNITARFKIINKAKTNQIELADTNIALNFTTEELNCTASDTKEAMNAETLAITDSLWESGLEGDGYRYTGTNPDNYICFGTTNKDECINNPDAYMYRIIGVFPGSEGNQHMKLIKKEALNMKMKWNDNYTNANWGESILNKNINDIEEGSAIYLKNSTYMPAGWSDRITSWKWRAVNTLSENDGTYYWKTTPKGIYQNEMLMKENSGVVCGNNSNSTSARCMIGELTSPVAQIGIIYVSDYVLSLGKDALDLSPQEYATLKTGWIHISNNDSENANVKEWTMTRYGHYAIYDSYAVWAVHFDGSLIYHSNGNAFVARPTFYLNSQEKIKSGSGTIDNPFILS